MDLARRKGEIWSGVKFEDKVNAIWETLLNPVLLNYFKLSLNRFDLRCQPLSVLSTFNTLIIRIASWRRS